MYADKTCVGYTGYTALNYILNDSFTIEIWEENQ